MGGLGSVRKCMQVKSSRCSVGPCDAEKEERGEVKMRRTLGQRRDTKQEAAANAARRPWPRRGRQRVDE